MINLITIGIISLSLLVMSTFVLVFLNLRTYLDTWKSQIQVTAYLADALPEEQVESLKQAITGFTEAKEVRYTSKDQALSFLEQTFPEQSGALAGLKENPLPASLDIRLHENHQTLEQISAVAARVERLAGVQEVEYGKSWLEGYVRFLRFVRTAGLAVGAIILLATVFIISNTIKLTMYARREEIEIMRLVGATSFFIRTPFFVEGIVQGLVGASLALGVLAVWFHLFSQWATRSSLFPFHLISLSFLPWHYVSLIIAGGMLTGLLGSFFSLGRYVRI